MNKSLCLAAFSVGAILAGGAVAAAQEPAPTGQAPTHPHTVAAGESLSKISQAVLGTADRWIEIFALNVHTLANPDVIEVGQVLDVPTAPVVVPADLLAGLAPAPAPAPVPSRQTVRTGQGASSPPAARFSSGGGGDGHLASIRACESGGDYGLVSSSGQYRGAYQFDRQTWQSVGGSGDPAAASPAEQDARARQLRSQRGSSPWPNCG